MMDFLKIFLCVLVWVFGFIAIFLVIARRNLWIYQWHITAVDAIIAAAAADLMRRNM